MPPDIGGKRPGGPQEVDSFIPLPKLAVVCRRCTHRAVLSQDGGPIDRSKLVCSRPQCRARNPDVGELRSNQALRAFISEWRN
jgi:ribosomal protein L40E